MANMVDLDSLYALSSALQQYNEDLANNEGVINQAVDVFDQSMGSGPIAQRKKVKIQQALQAIHAAVSYAEMVAYEAIRKAAEANDIVDGA